MKTLIVYYSLEGNTRLVAQRLAEATGAELLELKPAKAYPTGRISKFYFGGKSAVMCEKPVLEPYSADVSQYGTVILGTPVWAGRCTPPLRSFLGAESLLGKRVAFFACAGGDSAGKTFELLEELSGCKPVRTELFVSPSSGKDAMFDEKLERLVSAVQS